MNDRFFRKQLYQVGISYQLDSFNPIYLDKTGELICKTEGKLKNWNGGVDGFQFVDRNEEYNGKLSMNSYWFSCAKQGDFDHSNIEKFIIFVNKNVELANKVYSPVHFNRIGVRLQYILKKNDAKMKSKYTSFFQDKFLGLQLLGTISTSAIGFELKNTAASVNVNVAYAKRATSNDINAPSEGLLIDLDFFRSLDKAGLDTISISNSELLEFVQEKYREIIYNIALEMGAVNEI